MKFLKSLSAVAIIASGFSADLNDSDFSDDDLPIGCTTSETKGSEKLRKKLPETFGSKKQFGIGESSSFQSKVNASNGNANSSVLPNTTSVSQKSDGSNGPAETSEEVD